MPAQRGANQQPQQPPDDGRRRGRKEAPIVGFGPIAQHARRLRGARTAAGSPSYKTVGERAQMSESAACDIASPTRRLCTPENCAAFLGALPVDGVVVRCEHAEFERRAALFRPDLTGVRDRPELRAAAAAALTADRVDDAILLERRTQAAEQPVPDGLPGDVPAAARLLADPPDDDALLWRVYLGGATPSDVKHWKARLDQLPPEPRPEPAPAPRISRRAAILGGLVTVAAAIGAGGYLVLDDDADSTSGQAGRGPTSPPPISPPAAGPAAAELDAILANVEQAPDVAGERPGGTAHVDFVLTTYGPAPTYPRQLTQVTEELDWSRAAPGRRVVTGTGALPTPERLPAGPPPYAPDQPSTDPAELRRALEARRRPGGATVLLLGVSDVCETYPLDRAQRVAVLRMLRAAPDLEYTGKTTVERLGVPGKAFSAGTADGARETLTFDPATGRVLAHETLQRQPDQTFALVRHIVFTRSTWDHAPD